MEDRFIEDSVKKRLVEAGLSELMEHGVADFSLRRVAIAAQVSCAAPYRHFKDKDELIRAVAVSIRDDWYLIAHQVSEVYKYGRREHVLELILTYARFWIGGGNFVSLLNAGMLEGFDEPILDAVIAYADLTLCDKGAVTSLFSGLLALTYGTVALVAQGAMTPVAAVDMLRIRTMDILSKG